MPLLFGEAGQDKFFEPMLHVMLSSPFNLFSEDSNKDAVSWLPPLSSLCKSAHTSCGGRGVGVIGMCLTGHLPLVLLNQPSVAAPVLCEPSVPLPIHWVPSWRDKSLGITADELTAGKKAVEERNLKIMALRFTEDRRCPGGTVHDVARRVPRTCGDHRDHVA